MTTGYSLVISCFVPPGDTTGSGTSPPATTIPGDRRRLVCASVGSGIAPGSALGLESKTNAGFSVITAVGGNSFVSEVNMNDGN